jgi:hypothetical protein
MEIAELLVEQEDLKKSDISHMDELTQYKILLIQLQNRQTREFNDLLYGSDYTAEKEDKLYYPKRECSKFCVSLI